MGIILAIIVIVLTFAVVIPLLTLYSSFVWGYVASIIYEWFIMSQIEAAPLIEWWQFAGVMFFVRCFIHPEMHMIKSEYKDNQNIWVTILTAPWLVLFGAWIFKLFMY